MMKVVYKKDMQVGEKTETCLLKILAYFSVFDFPLSVDEIRRFLPPGVDAACLENALENLIEEKIIFKIDDVYLLHDSLLPVKRKQQCQVRAEQLLPKAMKIGRFLCRFPYVTGVGISGSLSKMYATENADIDFFIVTKPDRLWIARTFLHLYKKLTFITGKQHYHCMNYFLDEKALKLRDQNVYTAIETITLIPVCGEGIHDFFAANGWVSEWFAEYPEMMKEPQRPATRSWIKTIIEWLFRNKIGNQLDNYLMKLTAKRWKRKKEQRMLNYEGKEMSLITGKHFAWSNPDSFQQKILTLYDQKITELKNKRPGYFEAFNYSFGE